MRQAGVILHARDTISGLPGIDRADGMRYFGGWLALVRLGRGLFIPRLWTT